MTASRCRAQVCETHTAIVFFADDRAYQLKKPVDLGFLDYTTVAARRAACKCEVALNRRFALGWVSCEAPTHRRRNHSW
ncbi:hypothetical protein [Streptomyces sp. SM1]|uniref:hypothetical protein n=1 Tax=Streptomyces sp. SM1 TaxID=402229 RepID=UPI0035BC14EA